MKGFGSFGTGFFSTSTYPHPASLTLGVNGKVGAKQYCNETGGNCKTIEEITAGNSTNTVTQTDVIPAGAVMAFNLSTCPSGWQTSNGANGTVDLRGVFVRGLDSGVGKDPNRTLGSYQADAIAPHTHQMGSARMDTGSGFQSATLYTQVAGRMPTMTNGGAGPETRPKNVALLYCQKI